MVTFTDETGADEVAAVFKEKIRGKTILITGVSPNGLGAEAALSIATQAPGLIILASRDLSKVAQTINNIEAKAQGIKTRALKLDLASLAAVREAAAEVNSYEENIDVLINNAAVMACPYSATVDGFESQFGTNHLGHFLFTTLILGRIPKEGRIVNISSRGHERSGVRFEDPGFQNGEAYDKWLAYGQAKTANILFSVALAQRGVLSFSVHPGGILTELSRSLSQDELKEALKRPGLKMKTHQQGAATYIRAAFDPSLLEHNGAYMQDCNISEAAEYARSVENAEMLWKLSEDMISKSQRFNDVH